MEEINNSSDYKHKSNSQNFNNLTSSSSQWEESDHDRKSTKKSIENAQNQEAKQDKDDNIPDAHQGITPNHQQQQIHINSTIQKHPEITSLMSQQKMVSALAKQLKLQRTIANQQMLQQPPLSFPPDKFDYFGNRTYFNCYYSFPNFEFDNTMMNIDRRHLYNRLSAEVSVKINRPPSDICISSGKDMAVPGTGIGTNSYMDMTKDSSMFKEMITVSRFYPFSNGIECIPNFNHLEPIILSNAILSPPLPGEIPVHHRKPLGCRTVYVGCMPEKITEEIVREIFTRCGKIFSVRMSGSHFCHIRFADKEAVDQALLLSGFSIKIEENDKPAYNSKMHVDYALSRDDQYDYEQLELIQEKNHRKLQGFQPPSSPPLHYSELEAKNFEENFHDEQTFKKAVDILITRLERGECNKESAEIFYLMIKNVNSHVIKLNTEREEYDNNFHKANKNLENKLLSIKLDIKEINKVFEAAESQKVWDNFSEPQKSQIKLMKDNIFAMMETTSEASVNDQIEEEMNLCDQDDKLDEEPDKSLQDLVDSLNKMSLEFNQIYDFYQQSSNESQKTIDRLTTELEALRNKNSKNSINQNFGNETAEKSVTDMAVQCEVSKIGLFANETRFVSLIATFLHVHPFGASIDYICSYLSKIDSTVSTRDVENLLKKFPIIFKEKFTGIGATLEKKWTYSVINF